MHTIRIHRRSCENGSSEVQKVLFLVKRVRAAGSEWGNTSDFHILPEAISNSGDIPEHPHDLKCASASSQPSSWRPLTTAESL